MTPEELTARVLNPQRAMLDRVRSETRGNPCPACNGSGFSGWGNGYDAVCDDCGGGRYPEPVTDPAEFWELLASRELIPAEWTQTEGRSFASALPAENGVTLFAPETHPPDVAACVALASDVSGILTAESLAREIAAKLGLHPARILWQVEDRKALRERLYARGEEWDNSKPEKYNAIADVLGAFAAMVQHTRIAAKGGFYERVVRATTHAAQPALIALLATGYALEALGADAVTLVCPAL